MNILQNIREQGAAVIMVTHNIHLLTEFPGIVYQCQDGQIVDVTQNYN